MDKVKVSKELALAIESGLDYSDGETELLLEVHGRQGKWTVADRLPLNNLKLLQLAEILIKGYEVEETKEEKINKKYQSNYQTACTTPRIDVQWHANGFNAGIKYMNGLFELGLKLKEK